ncbi:hypothetical protein OS493_030142 [Desmophyllum pertusum]|uniref:Uncharacterized protein n=1 Tax=Desmophyllum pertusum TaxID=174260 RepID=A0A9X0CQP4_9CNID|nr:hypothetical protein OS493_030142 [Desmophyllum pertusum]
MNQAPSSVMFKIFAGGVIYFFLALMIERCCGLQMVGSCTFQVYINKARQCTTAFITDLQTDQSVDCKIIYSRMVECTKDYVRECVKDHVAPNDIEVEFVDAKFCLKEAVTQNCQFDADAAEILQSAFDEYNPFCNVGEEGEKDQPAKKGYYILDTQSNEEELAIGQCSIIAQLNRTRQCITLL